MAIVNKLRMACRDKCLSVTKSTSLSGIFNRLRLACGWEELDLAKEELRRQAGTTRTGGI